MSVFINTDIIQLSKMEPHMHIVCFIVDVKVLKCCTIVNKRK